MTSLYPIMAYALVLAYLSSLQSPYKLDSYDGKVYIYRERFFYLIMTIGMTVFVGLRTRGNDTYAYKDIYNRIQLGATVFSGVNWTNMAASPALQLLQNILKAWGRSAQEYIMLCALLTIPIYLWFIRKYTTDIWLSVFYFITMGAYTFAMAAIKQTICVAFLLVATDAAIQRKWGRFLFMIVLAELFHPYAFVYLIVPFLFFPPWSGKTLLLIAGTVLTSLFLSRLMGGIMALTETLGADYSETEFIGEGVNLFRVLVVWVPVILSFPARDYLRRTDDRVTNLVINASMINAFIMFIGLFGTANYFARLANYFLIFQTLSLPWVLRIFEPKSKRLVTAVSLLCYMAYFYYQCVLANGAFDRVYSFMTLGEFLTHAY